MQVAVNVFDLHRRVVDKNAHCQCHPAQSHDVECFTEETENDD